MKKLFLLFAVTGFIFTSCGSNAQKEEEATVDQVEQAQEAEEPTEATDSTNQEVTEENVEVVEE